MLQYTGYNVQMTRLSFIDDCAIDDANFLVLQQLVLGIVKRCMCAIVHSQVACVCDRGSLCPVLIGIIFRCSVSFRVDVYLLPVWFVLFSFHLILILFHSRLVSIFVSFLFVFCSYAWASFVKGRMK